MRNLLFALTLAIGLGCGASQAFAGGPHHHHGGGGGGGVRIGFYGGVAPYPVYRPVYAPPVYYAAPAPYYPYAYPVYPVAPSYGAAYYSPGFSFSIGR